MAKKDVAIETLLSKGLLTKEQINTAREDMKKTGLPIEKTLEKLGYITEEDIVKSVAESMNVGYIDLKHYLLNPELAKLLPERLARKYKVVPLFKIAKSLTVVMANPSDIVALDEIRVESGMTSIDPLFSTEKDIQDAIDQLYGTSGNIDDVIKTIDKSKIAGIGTGFDDMKALAKAAEDVPVVKVINLIIMQAVKDKASDIHIEPTEDMVRVRFRIDGILHETSTIPKNLQSIVASRIKILARMDIAESRKPQDGRIEFKIEKKALDLRVSSFPTIHGENIVMRILDKSSIVLGLEDLGFSKEDLKRYDKLIHSAYGIILVTGPTGSGKTTTLYSSLSTINSMDKNIITIEDPVEYELPLIRQTQVNLKAGISFATGLRSILRQDPNIIMVGEIRDKETADIAIQASLTGHLVFSTLHTNDAPSAVTRLIEMGIEPFLVSSSLIAILAQRLVRKICPACKEKYTPSTDVIKNLSAQKDSKEMLFYKGKGCDDCKNTGYQGRVAIYELLVMTEEIRKLVVKKSSADEIKKKAIEEGMRALREDGLDKIRQGITTVEEVLRVTEE